MLTLLIIILVLQVFQIGIIIYLYLSTKNIKLEGSIRGEDLYWSQNNAPK